MVFFDALQLEGPLHLSKCFFFLFSDIKIKMLFAFHKECTEPSSVNDPPLKCVVAFQTLSHFLLSTSYRLDKYGDRLVLCFIQKKNIFSNKNVFPRNGNAFSNILEGGIDTEYWKICLKCYIFYILLNSLF